VNFRFLKHALRLLLASGVLVGLAVGIAHATIPDTSGVIHGCYNPELADGLRVIDTDAGQACKADEEKLDWNQTGPPGPAGPQGPRGAQGPAGPAGSTGQSVATSFGTNSMTVGPGTTPFGPVPGLAQTITVPQDSVVYIASDGGIAMNRDGNTYWSRVQVSIFIDGSLVTVRSIEPHNYTGSFYRGVENWDMSLSTALSAGPHTITVQARSAMGWGETGGSQALVSAGDGPLRGQLTVAIVKQ
jgi:hypothetical protein